ncbi:YgdI/YgdR family lipoprotein [Enterobacter cloacae complex sp. 2024EL-00215]|uniref:YgdI/YgdR family lipoprotein n=1 Tax=unclassified Enterobacter cloacae complex TaxID=2757714 RepID=UPI003751B2E3
MKHYKISLVSLAMVFMAVGCSSDYVISSNDGHMISTHGKPKIDKDTGLISYNDADGGVHQIHQSDVKEIVEK